MATRAARHGRNGSELQQAMALLVNNQAALVAQHTKFLDQMADSHKEFARIRKELELIKAVLARHETLLEKLPDAIGEVRTVLARHETMLERLPEAVRAKIGYQKAAPASPPSP